MTTLGNFGKWLCNEPAALQQLLLKSNKIESGIRDEWKIMAGSSGAEVAEKVLKKDFFLSFSCFTSLIVILRQ